MSAPTGHPPTGHPPTGRAPGATATADQVRRARLTPTESQAVFRVLLDALSRPGRPQALPAAVARRMPPALVPLLALADVEVAVAVSPGDDGWTDAVVVTTGARASDPRAADWVALLEPFDPALIAALRRGSATAPEAGARVSIAVADLQCGVGDGTGIERSPWVERTVLRLRGPGVDGRTDVVIGGLHPAVAVALRAANAAFPAGIDAWFVAQDGRVVGLPRSTSIEVLEPAAPPAPPSPPAAAPEGAH